MAHTISYLDQKTGVLVELSGRVDDRELVQSLHDRFDFIERVPGVRYLISDWTRVSEAAITSAGVKATSELFSNKSRNFAKICSAGIQPADFIWGMARMSQAYADDDVTGWNTKIFRNRRDGELWLEETLGVKLQFCPDEPGKLL